MKYLLSIVLLALIGFTTPKKTIPAYDWGSVSAEPDLSWADQVGAQRTPHVRAKRSKCFITASGWNDSLRIENFYLFNIRAQVKTAGKIVYGKKVRLSEIYLEVEDKSQVRQEYNIDSKIEISYQ